MFPRLKPCINATVPRDAYDKGNGYRIRDRFISQERHCESAEGETEREERAGYNGVAKPR